MAYLRSHTSRCVRINHLKIFHFLFLYLSFFYILCYFKIFFQSFFLLIQYFAGRIYSFLDLFDRFFIPFPVVNNNVLTLRKIRIENYIITPLTSRHPQSELHLQKMLLILFRILKTPVSEFSSSTFHLYDSIERNQAIRSLAKIITFRNKSNLINLVTCQLFIQLNSYWLIFFPVLHLPEITAPSCWTS